MTFQEEIIYCSRGKQIGKHQTTLPNTAYLGIEVAYQYYDNNVRAKVKQAYQLS